jgi:hypothetical protein
MKKIRKSNNEYEKITALTEYFKLNSFFYFLLPTSVFRL